MSEKRSWVKTADTWIGLGMIVLSLAMIFYTRGRNFRSLMGLNPGVFPIFVFAILGFCGLLVLIQALRGKGMQKVQDINWVGTVVVTVVVFAYTFAIELMGFTIATFLFLMILLYFFNKRNWKTLLFVSLGVSVITFLLFTYAFQIPLPTVFL